jgi:hypothetical protein
MAIFISIINNRAWNPSPVRAGGFNLEPKRSMRFFIWRILC